MDLERFRSDPAFFAERLVGEELWTHQKEAIASPARITSIVAGRQSGKSRTVAIASLHRAFTKNNAKVLLVSASQASAERLLQEVAGLCRSPLLQGSVVDDLASEIRLSNGSVVASVPASQKAIRGWSSVDLLVVDEACFVAADIWQAARWVVIANPDSRIMLCSSPYGRRDAWFALEYRAGLRGEGDRASHHWPSWLNPLVDQQLLDMWRETSTSREFAAEVEGCWNDDEGSMFSAELLEAVTADFDPADYPPVVGGVDWARTFDACALVTLAVESPGDAAVYRVSRTLERFKRDPVDFVEDVVALAKGGVGTLVSESNGIGETSTSLLIRRAAAVAPGTEVVRLNTTTQTRASGYGQIQILMQQGRLWVPRSASGLLRQLSLLEYEVLESGAERISVPAARGHDDLASALSFCGWYLSNGRVLRRAENRRKLRDTANMFASANRGLMKPSGSDWISRSPQGDDRWR